MTPAGLVYAGRGPLHWVGLHAVQPPWRHGGWVALVWCLFLGPLYIIIIIIVDLRYEILAIMHHLWLLCIIFASRHPLTPCLASEATFVSCSPRPLPLQAPKKQAGLQHTPLRGGRGQGRGSAPVAGRAGGGGQAVENRSVGAAGHRC